MVNAIDSAVNAISGVLYKPYIVPLLLMKHEPGKTFMLVFRLCATGLVFLGAVISAGLAWDTSDLLQAMMVLINVPVILLLSKPALRALKDYEKQ